MDSAFLHVVIPQKEINVSVKLENMPVIDQNVTEETKRRIAYEVLKRMKAKGLIHFFVYTEESVEDNEPEKAIDLV